MIVKINNLFFTCFAFLGIVLSNSQVIINWGIGNLIEYFSYFILLICIFLSFFKDKKTRVYKLLFLFIVVTILFTFGIFLQDLTFFKKLYLSFSMVIISTIGILSTKVVNNVSDFKKISYSLLFGVFISFVLGIIFHAPMTTLAVEGISSSFGFNGGLQHKNYFAITIFLSYILLYISQKYGDKTQRASCLLWFQVFLIIISNSRTVYLLLLLFWTVSYSKILSRIKTQQKSLFIVIIFVFLLICGRIFYNLYILKSGSYMIRLQGIINYFNYYSSDFFHLFFGNAELGFGDSTHDYTYNIRSVVGWDGTVELSLLSVMVKNGYLGLIGYIIIIILDIFRLKRVTNSNIKVIGFSILAPLLLSAMVENYIASINVIFMPVCFCVLSSIANMEQSYLKEEI